MPVFGKVLDATYCPGIGKPCTGALPGPPPVLRRLPPELRMKIYRHAFEGSRVQFTPTGRKNGPPRFISSSHQMVLHTCRRWLWDALPTFAEETVWVVDAGRECRGKYAHLSYFLDELAVVTRHHVRHLRCINAVEIRHQGHLFLPKVLPRLTTHFTALRRDMLQYSDDVSNLLPLDVVRASLAGPRAKPVSLRTTKLEDGRYFKCHSFMMLAFNCKIPGWPYQHGGCVLRSDTMSTAEADCFVPDEGWTPAQVQEHLLLTLDEIELCIQFLLRQEQRNRDFGWIGFLNAPENDSDQLCEKNEYCLLM